LEPDRHDTVLGQVSIEEVESGDELREDDGASVGFGFVFVRFVLSRFDVSAFLSVFGFELAEFLEDVEHL
jgi:hypothetical protein